jgi:hypothetical protein
MTLSQKGTIVKILDTEHVTDNYSKREFVLLVDGKYPQEIMFTTGNKNTELLNNLAEGEEVSVEFNLRGKKWTNKQGEDKWFISLDAWKITSLSTESASVSNNHSAPKPIVNEDDNDDLPF